MVSDEKIREAANCVINAYRGFSAPTVDARNQLAEISNMMERWFELPHLVVAQTASYCIDRFVDGETDFVTEGNRGYGRVGEFPPRLGSRHRAMLAKMNGNTVRSLGQVIKNHIVCGYIFAEFTYEMEHEFESQISRENDALVSPTQLFELWIPDVYSGFFNLDALSNDEQEIKAIWFGSTGSVIRDQLKANGAVWEEIDHYIVTCYFHAGMLLRFFQANPMLSNSKSPNVQIVAEVLNEIDILSSNLHSIKTAGLRSRGQLPLLMLRMEKELQNYPLMNAVSQHTEFNKADGLRTSFFRSLTSGTYPTETVRLCEVLDRFHEIRKHCKDALNADDRKNDAAFLQSIEYAWVACGLARLCLSGLNEFELAEKHPTRKKRS